MNAYPKLKKIFKRYYHLQNIQRMMMWDEAVMMPSGSGNTRGQVMGTLNYMAQKLLTLKSNSILLDAAEKETLSPWDTANLHWMKKKYIAATCIPLKLTEELTQTTMACEQAWRTMRQQNNWR